MKYKPFPHRPRPIDFNQRRASAFQRKQNREANALPLFAEQIREQQHDWETEKDARQRRDDACVARWRLREAALWRKARSMYFALPEQDRASCRQDWVKVFRGAWTPTSLIYLIEKYNGVGAEREARMAADRKAMNDRITTYLLSQQALAC
ncbi:hypothetical protein [Pseudomonas sp. MF6776]|uniref:hypothetical protein n=1 Tax=Pseudomonas sp. MF6776 TaxID=2797534 RepID=UPI00190A35F7|nr:hypothetical protein [Pseudomonas sp. MF6776]MBK3468116.1 hypothetical protein [Pseudomonas sp. MF6776]